MMFNTPCDLEQDGLLWLINRVVFHPRGFALQMVVDTENHEKVFGFALRGNADEPFVFSNQQDDEKFKAVETLFAKARKENDRPIEHFQS
jgi:hypothetical protein